VAKLKAPPVNVFAEFSKKLREKNATPDLNNYVPHEKQIQFHSANVRRRLFIGGNRSGKTVAGGVETVKVLTRRHEFIKWGPYTTIHGRGCAVDFTQGIDKVMLPMIARWLPPSELINGSWEDSYSKSARTLTLANGNDIEFLSYDQELEKFAGTSRHFIWYDEEPPQDVYDECQLRLLDTKGYSWATMTPVLGMTWVYDALYLPGLDPENTTTFTVEVSTDDNPNIDIAFAETEIFANLTADDQKARRHGKFIQRAGLIYPNFSVEANVVDPFIPDKDWLHAASLDHGLTNPTAWLWHAVDPKGNIWVYDEHYMSGLLVNQHADIVHRKNAEHDVEPRYYIGDPSIKAKNAITGGSIQEEYASCGLFIGLADNNQIAGISRTRDTWKALIIASYSLPPTV
jgi:phage terminase large subunit-like protein